MDCPQCGRLFERKTATGRTPRFCSSDCRVKHWQAENPERTRELDAASRQRRREREQAS